MNYTREDARLDEIRMRSLHYSHTGENMQLVIDLLDESEADKALLTEALQAYEWNTITGFCHWCGGHKESGRGHARYCMRQRALGI